ncbi:MAG: D-glycero-beta-D-manno-heptose 1-phosphate adenylyltransferase [Deltaproteobacteria bacterium]|nr:D-glycero-beta-D-manno-heptose 1-phosphate adenylyltransferase [Deltaproteobacteria bacterium]
MTLVKRIKVPTAAGIVQFEVTPADYQANLTRVQNSLARLQPTPGTLVVLPELWGGGFAYADLINLARRSPELLDSLRQLAANYDIIIAGSLWEEDGGAYFNTLFVSGAAGIMGQYRKQHLFEPMAEDRHLQPGCNPSPITTPYGLCAGLVCYDLRFPELTASQVGRGAACIIVTAQWPAARLGHWQTLLQARAIENQAFVVACNSSGIAGGIKFAGHSMIIAPDGSVLREAGNTETEFIAKLDGQILEAVRTDFNTVAPAPYHPAARAKILSRKDLQQHIAMLRAIGKRVVFTNGCFDIIHQGHTTYLEEARRQGDCLVVGLNSDASVRAIKGPERPVNSADSRAVVLAALGCVDYISIFAEETPLDLIKTVRPDILVKGADWPVEKIVGAREVMARGGRVINIPTVRGFSTTSTIGAIRERS